MATNLTYTTSPISRRVDPRGRYYARIESNPLSPEESIRGIMSYKKITAYSESTVLQLLNDLLQGAVELTALDGKTRTLGQMLRVYMALEGSFETPVLTPADKTALKVRTQLLKDLKWPVDPANFSLVAKDATSPIITGVHYSGQQDTADALKVGSLGILVGRALDLFDLESHEIQLLNPATGVSVPLPVPETGYQPSYNALTLDSIQPAEGQFTGTGPWSAELRLVQYYGEGEGEYVVLSVRAITLLPATA